MAFSKYCPERFVMVIGKVGCGKSTLINKISGTNTISAGQSFTRVTDTIQQTVERKYIDENLYELDFIDTIGLRDVGENPSYEQSFSNSEGIVMIKKALKDRFKHGVSIIFVTLRYKSFTKDDENMFKLLQTHFKPKFWNLAVLVITHCEGVEDRVLKEYIQELKSTEPAILNFEDRIVTTGFPDLNTIREEFKKQYTEEIEKDIKKLDNAIKEAKYIEPYEEIVCNEPQPSTGPSTSRRRCNII